MSDEPRRRGRQTKEQEARAYLEEHGVDPDSILGPSTDGPMPKTFEEMRDAFMRLLWAKQGEVKGTAIVQGLRAVAALAETQRGQVERDEKVLIADVVRDANLPVERKRQI